MKKIVSISIMIGLIIGFYSCQKQFLEKPDTTGAVNLDKAYSSTKNAEGVLFNAYRRALIHGWPGGWGADQGALGSISGERYPGYDWHTTWEIAMSGLKPTETRGCPAGADNYPETWSCIRASFLIKENIDKVPDMSAEMKGYIKGECAGLIAYRYMGMFYRYGGVPIITKSYLPSDNMLLPRTTLQETLDYTLQLCDEAYNALPDEWPAVYAGRMTKGAALAIKARVLMFAARPLFNSTTPYLVLGTHDNLICFGNEDPARWQTAITANEAVVTWASANGYKLLNTGGAGVGQPNPNAVDDYGTATSVPGNKEVILAYKVDEPTDIGVFYNCSLHWPYEGGWNEWETDVIGMPTNFLENYYLKDGTTPDWPKVGDPAPHDSTHWFNNARNLEVRYRVDNISPGLTSLSNPGDPLWNIEGWDEFVGCYTKVLNEFPANTNRGKGCAQTTKFYYKAGSRIWFEPPLFRMAETYLNLAEAYNESGNPSKGLEALNMVHTRAGLPSLIATGKDELRRLIWREKAIEFYGENQRYYDVKHWKHPNIGNGIIGGQMRELVFFVSASPRNLASNQRKYWDSNSYIAYWHPKMYLEPFPQYEVNKGVIIQNPGY